MRVYREFRLEVDGEECKWGGDGTHVKDMENPVKIQLPRGNRLFVVLREGVARRSAQPLDAPLDRGHSPTIEGMVSKLAIIPTLCWYDSRRQLFDGLQYRWTELRIGLSAIHPPVESSADIRTG